MRDAPLGLIEWATHALQPMRPAMHHRRLLSDLQAVADGGIDRLIVAMPPGSAKSTYCSVLLPAWWLQRHPGHSIIAACHTEALANSFGRRARAMVAEHSKTLGLQLARDERAAGQWSVEGGGSYFAAGIRGPIVGRRADLVLIDVGADHRAVQRWHGEGIGLIVRALAPTGSAGRVARPARLSQDARAA